MQTWNALIPLFIFKNHANVPHFQWHLTRLLQPLLISQLWTYKTNYVSKHFYVTVLCISCTIHCLLLLLNIYITIYLFTQIGLTSLIKWQIPRSAIVVYYFIFPSAPSIWLMLHISYDCSPQQKMSMLILKPLFQFYIYK